MEDFLEEVIVKVAPSQQVKTLVDNSNTLGDNPGIEEKPVQVCRGLKVNGVIWELQG